jgi:hypothetical protein
MMIESALIKAERRISRQYMHIHSSVFLQARRFREIGCQLNACKKRVFLSS